MMKKFPAVISAIALLAFPAAVIATPVITFPGSSGAYRFLVRDTSNQDPTLFQRNFDALTVEYWVKPTATIGDYVMYVVRGPANTGAIGKGLWWSGLDKETHCLNATFNTINETPATSSGGNFSKGLTQATLPLNQWTHVAAAWTGGPGGHCEIYTNGILAATYSTDLPMTGNGAGELVFGGTTSHSNTGRFFKGRMSDIRIWNHARTPSQIFAFHNRRLTGSENGLIGYWKMDEGSGTVAADSTANGNRAVAYSGKTATASSVTWADDADLVFAEDVLLLANPVTGSPAYLGSTAATLLSAPADASATQYQATLGNSAAALAETDWLPYDPFNPPSQIVFHPAPAADGEITVTLWTRGAGTTNRVSGTIGYATTPPTVVTRPLSVVLDSTAGIEIAPEDVDGGSSDPTGIHSLSVAPSVVHGPGEVTLTVMNEAGISASATATVTVTAYRDIHVAPGGDDEEGTGRPEAPYATIAHALGVAAARASAVGEACTVFVAAGAYSAASGETFPLEIAENVSLVGAGIGQTILDGAGADSLLRVPSATTARARVTGLSLRRSAAPFIDIRGKWDGAIEDCEISGMAESPISDSETDAAILFYDSASLADITLSGLVVSNVHCSLRHLMAVRATNLSTLTITNCVFRDLSTTRPSAAFYGTFHFANASGSQNAGVITTIADSIFEDIEAPGGAAERAGFFLFGATSKTHIVERSIFRNISFTNGEMLFAPMNCTYFHVRNSLVHSIAMPASSTFSAIMGGYGSRPQPRGCTFHDCDGAVFRPNPGTTEAAYGYNCSISSCGALSVRSGLVYLHNCNVHDTPAGEGYNADNSEYVTGYAPNYADPANGDFRLKSYSQLIDAGYALSTPGFGSLDGNDRNIDGDGDGVAKIDIGAYEFKPGDGARLQTAQASYGLFPGQTITIPVWVEPAMAGDPIPSVSVAITYPQGVTGPSTAAFSAASPTNLLSVTASNPLAAASGTLLEMKVSDTAGALDDLYVGLKLSEKIITVAGLPERIFLREGETLAISLALPDDSFAAPDDIPILLGSVEGDGTCTIAWEGGEAVIPAGASVAQGTLVVTGGSGANTASVTVGRGFVLDVTGESSASFQVVGYEPPLYVGAAGSDATGLGTRESPLGTMAYAISLLRAGETVHLLPGVYAAGAREPFPVIVPPGIALEGERGPLGTAEDTSVLDGLGASTIAVLGTLGASPGAAVAGGALRGLELRNGAATALRTRYWSGTIEDCYLHGVEGASAAQENTAALHLDSSLGAITLSGVEIACITSSLPRVLFYNGGSAGNLTVTNCHFHDIEITGSPSNQGIFDFRRPAYWYDTVLERVKALHGGSGNVQSIVHFRGFTAIVNRCVFRDLDLGGHLRFSAVGFYAGPTMLVANSLFHGIRGEFDGMTQPCAAIGSYNGDYRRYVRNCTFHDCSSINMNYFGSAAYSSNHFFNCSISSCGQFSSTAALSEGRVVELRNVNLHDTAEGMGYTTNASSFVTSFAPGYRNAAAGDFTLRSSSPLVDAGDNDGISNAMGAFDLAWKPRVADGDRDHVATIDIGAYEAEPRTTGTIFVLR